MHTTHTLEEILASHQEAIEWLKREAHKHDQQLALSTQTQPLVQSYLHLSGDFEQKLADHANTQDKADAIERQLHPERYDEAGNRLEPAERSPQLPRGGPNLTYTHPLVTTR